MLFKTLSDDGICANRLFSRGNCYRVIILDITTNMSKINMSNAKVVIVDNALMVNNKHRQLCICEQRSKQVMKRQNIFKVASVGKSLFVLPAMICATDTWPKTSWQQQMTICKSDIIGTDANIWVREKGE